MDIELAQTIIAVLIKQFGDNNVIVVKHKVYEALPDKLGLEVQYESNGDVTVTLLEEE